MLALNVVGADTRTEARRLFTTQQQSFVRLRRGHLGLVPPPIDDIEAFWTPAEKAMVAESLACNVVGDPADLREGIADFVERHRPDELMLTGNVFDHDARKHSFALASQAFIDTRLA
jgi:alkanesulfonate monooxygenase SsuD/methylene tetrahydromethanopterin reductase-like flavin-dependent oxidoreductase (luciferase family)